MKTNPEALKQAIRILTSIEGLNVTQTLAIFQVVDLLDNHMEQQDKNNDTNHHPNWDEILKEEEDETSSPN